MCEDGGVWGVGNVRVRGGVRMGCRECESEGCEGGVCEGGVWDMCVLTSV